MKRFPLKNSLKKIIALGLAAVCAAGLLAACAPVLPEGEEGLLDIVATVFPAWDMARQVAGDAGQAAMLLSPGEEPHFYEPSPQDITAISGCDLFIYVGGASDSWVEELLPSLTLSGRVLRLMDFVTPLEDQAPPGSESQLVGESVEGPIYDEHIWLSLQNAQAIARAIAGALAELSPGRAASFGARAQNYTQSLAELDETFRGIVDDADRNTLVFAGCFPARYFTQEYGLDYYAAFPGCALEREPSAAAMAYLVDKVRAEEIPFVLYVEFSDQSLADTVAGETGAGKLLFHTCHNVTKAQLQEGVTYLSLMRQNAEALREALN